MNSTDSEWLPDEPGPFEQASEPAEIRGMSRADQWREHMSAVFVVGFLAACGLSLLLWAWLS